MSISKERACAEPAPLSSGSNDHEVIVGRGTAEAFLPIWLDVGPSAIPAGSIGSSGRGNRLSGATPWRISGAARWSGFDQPSSTAIACSSADGDGTLMKLAN